ncbi:MAG: metal-dependent hydrolase, partial [Actinomycetia bacterium]|nr:metal-dependent hydrolase [Actinomycetes bacterium]
MATITVRRPVFEWPSDLSVVPSPDDPQRSCETVALSFTLPYLEPYLIRTMRVAAKEVDDPDLSADIKAFSGQEAQHYKNHAAVNDIVRQQLSDQAAAAMRELEDRLEADYRRFTAEKSLAFNLAYAEGFEAMTFSLARSSMSADDSAVRDSKWTELM